MCLKALIACKSLLILPAIKEAIKVNEGEIVGVEEKLDYVSINRNIRKKDVNLLVLEAARRDSIYYMVSAIFKENPSTKIIIITNNCVVAKKTIKIEAVYAIITINETVDELVEAIFFARYDQKYSSPTDQRTRMILTPRERQTFRLLKKGFSKKQIAKFFEVNVDTIRTHSRNINAKLGTQF